METVTFTLPLNSPLLAGVIAVLLAGATDDNQPAPAAAEAPKRGRGRPPKNPAPAPAPAAAEATAPTIDVKETLSAALKQLGPVAVRDVFKKHGIGKMSDASPADQIKVAETLDELMMMIG